VIIVVVQWYLRYRLSYRDVAELLAERGTEVDHVTICQWIQRVRSSSADVNDSAQQEWKC
jgi:transposase-like protein